MAKQQRPPGMTDQEWARGRRAPAPGWNAAPPAWHTRAVQQRAGVGAVRHAAPPASRTEENLTAVALFGIFGLIVYGVAKARSEKP